MADDVTLTRRRTLLAHLEASGGTMALAELHDWSALKLLAAHQAFSQLMEGLVDDGMVRWDGGVFNLTDEGRAEAALAPKRRRGAARAVKAALPADAPLEVAPARDASEAAPPPTASPPTQPTAAQPTPPAAAPTAPAPSATTGGASSVAGSDGAAQPPDPPLPRVDPPRIGLLRRALRRIGRVLDRR